MRSFGFTLILALLAIAASSIAAWHGSGRTFSAVFGVPPTPVGGKLYASFTPDQVKHISVYQNGVSATFSLGPQGWQANSPWQDRMDPRAAVGIINFTLGMRVEDLEEADAIDARKAGLDESAADIRLEGTDHRRLARYKLGRRTPWLAEVEGMEKPVPTVFVQPRDRNRKSHTYACTGDIGPLFKDNLKFLRDHRPFYFNPIHLRKIRIRAGEGEFTLGRESPTSPWRVVKPLDLPTDPAAMKRLLEGLYEFQAVRVSDRSAVTLPAAATTTTTQIALNSFGSEEETVLDIFPPESPDVRDLKATVSDRPNTVFDLPAKPEPDLLSLADLPLAVNDLRNPTLSNLNIQSLRAIAIQPSTGTEIVISRTPPQPWMATIEGTSREANEERLFTLLKTVTEGRAIGYESDAATDLTPWGLDRPFLKLRFLGQDNQALEMNFGIDGKGGFFVNRTGSPTVMRVDQSLVSSIPVRPYEWRHSRIWSLNRVNLLSIERSAAGTPPILLKYQFLPDETWQASRDGADITADIDPARAGFVLSNLEGLKVNRWLSPTDEAASNALLAPTLTFRILEKTTDDMGDRQGFATRSIRFAPNVPVGTPSFYYGRLESDPNPFLLDRETYQKIATEILAK